MWKGERERGRADGWEIEIGRLGGLGSREGKARERQGERERREVPRVAAASFATPQSQQ